MPDAGAAGEAATGTESLERALALLRESLVCESCARLTDLVADPDLVAGQPDQILPGDPVSRVGRDRQPDKGGFQVSGGESRVVTGV